MKNQKILALSLCLVLILGLSFAMAAENKVGKDKSHFSCVFTQAKVKNSCYKIERETYKECHANVREQYKNETITDRTQIKDMNAACRTAYKETKNQCKLTFKVNKEDCEKLTNSPQDEEESSPQDEEESQEQENERVALNSNICNDNGGIWNECGNRCLTDNQGQANVSCAAVCEEVCECGTGANLTCPAEYDCKAPQGFANALGYCD